jgi:amidohydrolase
MKKLLIAIITFLAAGVVSGQPAEAIKTWNEKNFGYLDTLYKYLHRNPEISLSEKNTSRVIASHLKNYGYQVTEGFGGNGVVGVINNGTGPVIMIRTDMDALPVKEETGAEYASKVIAKDKNGSDVPVMHACGHDIHMSVFLGTGRYLAQNKNLWKGTLILVGQPAEEVGVGAKEMLEAGLYSKFPKPDYVLAIHDNAFIPSGSVGMKPGYAMASVDRIDIKIFGRGGHGAAPHTTIDPVVMASQMILAYQTIVSRETNPINPSVLTVGSIHAGTTHNIIPSEVKLQLTLRSYSDEVREATLKSLRRISDGIATAAGMDKMPEIIVDPYFTPSTYNDLKLTERLTAIFKQHIGTEKVVNAEPYMVGEDFCFYGRDKNKIPTCIYWVGAVSPDKITEYRKLGKQLPSLHSSLFLPDYEPAIKTGILSMSVAVLDLMKK